jgi:hypothetical protein
MGSVLVFFCVWTVLAALITAWLYVKTKQAMAEDPEPNPQHARRRSHS